MWSGKRFKLRRPTLAIDSLGAKRHVITVPAGITVKVVSGPKEGDRLVDVLWGGRSVAMFAIDLKQRAEEMPPQASATHN